METRKQLVDYLINRSKGKEEARRLLEEIDQAVTDSDPTPFLLKGEVSVGRECAIEWELMTEDTPGKKAVQDFDDEDEDEDDDEDQEGQPEQGEDDASEQVISRTLGLRLWRPQDATEPQLSVTVWASGSTTRSDWKEIKRLQTLLGGALHRYRYGEDWDEDLLELKRLPLSNLDVGTLAMDIVEYARRMRNAA